MRGRRVCGLASQSGSANECVSKPLDAGDCLLEAAQRVVGVIEEAGHALSDGQIDLRIMDNVGRRPRWIVVGRLGFVVAQVLGNDLFSVHIMNDVWKELSERTAVVQCLTAQLSANEQLTFVARAVDAVDALVVSGRGEVV